MPWPILPIDKEQRLDGITPGIETTAPRTQQAKRAKESGKASKGSKGNKGAKGVEKHPQAV